MANEREGGVETENPPNKQARQPQKPDAPNDSKANEKMRE